MVFGGMSIASILSPYSTLGITGSAALGAYSLWWLRRAVFPRVRVRVSEGSGDSSFRSYELDLVLKDGTRLNVVDHGHFDWLRRDAEALATFLGKPLSDATATPAPSSSAAR